MLTTFLMTVALVASVDHGAESHAHHHTAESMAQSVVAADVRTVDTETRTTLLRHEAMPELGMPAMVMEFTVADDVDIDLFQPGAALIITATMGTDGLRIIAAEPESDE